MDQDIIKYVAGVVDSSSYITIRYIKYSYVASVRLRRDSPEVLEKIRDHFGGNIGTSYKDGVTLYWINYQGRKAAEFLRKIYPYLQRKHGHAQLVFALAEEIRDHLTTAGVGKNLSEEQRDRRRHIYERMQAFNHVPVITTHVEVKKEDPTSPHQELDFLL